MIFEELFFIHVTMIKAFQLCDLNKEQKWFHKKSLWIHHIEGYFGDGKIWWIQHINIFGRIKFGKLDKMVCTSACLHAFIIQTDIRIYYNLQMKGVKPTWQCMYTKSMVHGCHWLVICSPCGLVIISISKH